MKTNELTSTNIYTPAQSGRVSELFSVLFLRMKIVLCLTAGLLLNLLTVPGILAKPIDEYDDEDSAYADMDTYDDYSSDPSSQSRAILHRIDDEGSSSETTTVASVTIVNEWRASNGKLFRTLLRDFLADLF